MVLMGTIAVSPTFSWCSFFFLAFLTSHIHVLACRCARANVTRRIHTHTQYAHIHLCLNTRVYTHTHTHTRAHTHTHAHIHTSHVTRFHRLPLSSVCRFQFRLRRRASEYITAPYLCYFQTYQLQLPFNGIVIALSVDEFLTCAGLRGHHSWALWEEAKAPSQPPTQPLPKVRLV